jgi:hypothetical protein
VSLVTSNSCTNHTTDGYNSSRSSSLSWLSDGTLRTKGPPVIEGQLFHFLGAPNRLRLPANYQLHVWAWKKNPKGTFADWNPDVSCAQYSGEVTQAHVSVH